MNDVQSPLNLSFFEGNELFWEPRGVEVFPEGSTMRCPDERIPASLRVALCLHPALDHAAVDFLVEKLSLCSPKLSRFAPGEVLCNPNVEPTHIHLVVKGMARGIVDRALAGNRRGSGSTYTYYQGGQWIGLPWGVFPRGQRRPPMRQRRRMGSQGPLIDYGVLAIGAMETIAIPIGEFRELLGEPNLGAVLRSFFRGQIHRRFADNVPRLLSQISRHPLLGLLEPADWVHLVQISDVYQYVGEERRCYLASGEPVDRTAFLLGGSARAFLKSEGRPVLVSEYKRGELVGHEQLATDREVDFQMGTDFAGCEDEDEVRAFEAAKDPTLTKAPRQLTDVYVTPGTRLMEFDWRALRFVLHQRRSVWSRTVSRLCPGTDTTEDRPTPITIFMGAAPHLGTTTLARGAAISMARLLSREQPEEQRTESSGVWVIDLQKPYITRLRDNAKVKDSQLKEGTAPPPEAGGEDVSFLSFDEDVGPDGETINITHAFCHDASRTDDLVRHLRIREDVRAVIISAIESNHQHIQDRFEGNRTLTTAEDLHQTTVHEVVEDLNALGATIVWVTDSPHMAYRGTISSPQELIFAECLTEDYLHKEKVRARVGLRDWLECWRADKPSAKHALKVLEEYDLFAKAQKDERGAQSRSERTRHVLRFPHRPFLARYLNGYGIIGLLDMYDKHPSRSALRRAVARVESNVGRQRTVCHLIESFGRLVRMILHRTVGVALGGGGAWGFTQIALLKELEERNVPVDYVAGVSFGSVVAGLYSAGGMEALDRLLDWSDPGSQRALEFVESVGCDLKNWSGWSSRLTWRANFAAITNRALQKLVDDILDEVLGIKGMPISTTPIPFWPVGASLGEASAVVHDVGTVGFGVRTASCLPPVFPTLLVGDDRVIDGGLVEIVPSRSLRAKGADFIVSCNVVPTTPPKLKSPELRRLARMFRPEKARRPLKELIEASQGTPQEPKGSLPWMRLMRQKMLGFRREALPEIKEHWYDFRENGSVVDHVRGLGWEATMARVMDAIHGFYLLSWKTGQDQAELAANYMISMQPEQFESFEFWQGRSVVERFQARLIDMKVADQIEMLWHTPRRWKDTPPQVFVTGGGGRAMLPN